MINGNLEENKNDGSLNSIAQSQVIEPLAKFVNLSISYKRVFLIKNENEVEGEIEEEEDDFNSVDALSIQNDKVQIIKKVDVNENVEVTLDVDRILQIFRNSMPCHDIRKVQNCKERNNKKVWTQVQTKPNSVLKVQATRIVDFFSELLANSENEERYDLELYFKLTMEKVQNNEQPQQLDSDVKSRITAIFYPNLAQNVPEETITQINPCFQKIDEVEAQTNLPVLNQSKSASTLGTTMTPEPPENLERDTSRVNVPQLTQEARISRLEEVLTNISSMITQAFQIEQKVQSNAPQLHQNLQNNFQFTNDGSEEGTQLHQNENQSDQDQRNVRNFQSDKENGYQNQMIKHTHKEHTSSIKSNQMPNDRQIPQLKQSSSQTNLIQGYSFSNYKNKDQILPYNLYSTQSPGDLNKQNDQSRGPEDFIEKSQLIHSHSMNFGNLPDLLTQSLKNSTLATINEACELRQIPDLIYLSSNPIVILNEKGQKVENQQQLNIDREIEQICSAIKQTNRQFNFKSQIGTAITLTQALQNGTKILHISCHGHLDKQKKEQTSLLFERTELSECGQGCEVKLEIFDALKNIHPGIKMVFLSACHSESVGKMFKAKGIPIVIAVDQSTKIYDDVCMVFAKYLYEKLINGQSPRQAFNLANSLVHQEKMDLFFCCCEHAHDINCPWGNARNQWINNLHYYHSNEKIESTCKCDQIEIAQKIQGPQRQLYHQKNCKYATEHSTKLIYLNSIYNGNNKEQFDKIEANGKEDFYYACCCQKPDQPHNEVSKFKFITVEDIKEDLSSEDYQHFSELESNQMNMPIFQNYAEGPFNWIEGNYHKNDHLNQRIQNYKLFGRSIEIQKIVQMIATMDKNNRLIHVYGEDGNGKGDITNFAARYALEGRVKGISAAHHIKIEHIITHEGLKDKILEEIGKHFPIQNQSLLPMGVVEHYYKENKYLIIIDKCQSFVRTDRKKFSLALLDLLQLARETIFLVISDDEKDLERNILKNYQKVHIDELNCRDAFKLFMNTVSNNSKDISKKIETFINNEKQKDPNFQPQNLRFFTDFKRKTEKIFQNALKITNNRDIKKQMEDLASSREKKEQYSQDGAQEIMEYFNKIFQIYPIKYHRNLYTLLFLISLSPGGLFKSDLDNLFKKSNHGLEWEPFIRFLGSQDEINNTIINNQYDIEIAINPSTLVSMQQHNFQHKNMGKPQISDINYQLPIPNMIKKKSSISSSELLIIDNPSSLNEILVLPSRYLKNSMKHKLMSFGFRAQDSCNIYEIFISYMIKFAHSAIDTQRIAANYSIEELNIVVDSSFLFPSLDLPWEPKKSQRHEGCSSECLQILQEEKIQFEEYSLILKKLHHYESNPKGILDLDFLKTYYFGDNFQEQQKKDKSPLPAEKIQQFCYLFVTLLISEEKFEIADSLLSSSIEIAEYFQLMSFQAKLYMIQVNLNLMKNNEKFRHNFINEHLEKVKKIWTKMLNNNQKVNVEDEEEKNEGDSLSYLLKNYQHKDSTAYHEIYYGNILVGFLKNIYNASSQFKSHSQQIGDGSQLDLDKQMRAFEDCLHQVSQLSSKQPLATQKIAVLTAKVQLFQIEIMMHALRERKQAISDRVNSWADMIAKVMNSIDLKFLQERGFTRFMAIYYRVKGYLAQWMAEKGKEYQKKGGNSIQNLQKIRIANQCLTIAAKLFKEVDLKDRSKEINQSIQSNFKILSTAENRTIYEQNLICFLYSMPLVKNMQALGEFYQQDLERCLKFYQKLEIIKERGQILDKIKIQPLNQQNLEDLNITKTQSKFYKQCSILHISTKCFDPEFLFIETSEGIGVQKSQEQLIEMLLSSETNNMSYIKLVVLAYPGSQSLGINVFSDKGVEHVISYEQLSQNQDQEQAFEHIDVFLGVFYEFLFKTKKPRTVIEAFHKTLKQLKKNVQNFDLMLIPQLTNNFKDGILPTLVFEKVPQNLQEERKYHHHLEMQHSLLGRKSLPKLTGRNFEIQQVVDFILQGHSPQEKKEQILRIVGKKNKQSIVEAAIHYLQFRKTIVINYKKIDVKASNICKIEELKQIFFSLAEQLHQLRFQHQYKFEEFVNIIVIYDFSELKPETFMGKMPGSKKARPMTIKSNEMGIYFQTQCDQYKDLKILLLQSQLDNDLMESSTKLLTIS